jgi:glycerophosphoryl diester phosphodiesterase
LLFFPFWCDQNGYFVNKQLGFDVVGTVVSSLNNAGLKNSERVLIQSEDSAILKSLNQSASFALVYRISEVNVTITQDVVKQIKALANYVTLPRRLIQPTFNGYLLNNTGVVDLFHAGNVRVFVSFLRNVFVTIPYDYESDPTSEIATMVSVFGVDGVITAFPATTKAYLSMFPFFCVNLFGTFMFS